jgi:transposase
LTCPPFSGHASGYGRIFAESGGREMADYTSEFKMIVAKRAMKAKTYSEVGRELGISSEQVRRWAQAYKQYGELAFEKDGPQIHAEQRMKELEKRIADLEEENEILKKVTAVFSKKQS